MVLKFKKTKKKKAISSSGADKKVGGKRKVVIPDKPTVQKLGPEDFLILLYGPPKVGKSTFAAEFHDPLFISMDRGLKFLEVREVPCESWATYLEIVGMLEAGEHSAGCIVVDRVDFLFNNCMRYVGEKHGFDHPSDEEYGKGWAILSSEFMSGITRICDLGVGVIFTADQKEKAVVSRSIEITRRMPNFPATCYNVINSIVDFIFFCGFETVRDKKSGEREERRIVYTKPAEDLDAGDRTGVLPEKMNLDYGEFVDHLAPVIK